MNSRYPDTQSLAAMRLQGGSKNILLDSAPDSIAPVLYQGSADIARQHSSQV